MVTPALKEWAQMVPRNPTVGDLLDNPRRAFFGLLFACVVGSLWRACFVLLSRLIKPRLCNSSSSTSVPPMARDQAGIRKWTSKIAPACRYCLLYLLEDELLGWLGWYSLVVGLREGSWWGVPVNFVFILTVIIILEIIIPKSFIVVKTILVKIYNRQWRRPTTAEVQTGTLEVLKLHTA